MTEDVSAGRLYVDILADTSRFRGDLEDKIKTETAGLKVQIATEIDARKLAEQAEVAAKAASERAKIKAQVEAETTKADTEIDAMRQRQSRRPIEIPVKADEKSLKALEKRLDSVGKKLIGASKITGIISGIPLAAGALTNLAGGIFSLASSLSQTTGLLAAVPGLALTAAQGIGVFKLSFDGLKQALKELDKVPPGMKRTKAQTDALNASMKKLTPEGRRFALMVHGDLEPSFQALQHAVQSALLPPLQRAVSAALPLMDTIRTAMTETAGRVGALTEAAGRLLGSPLFNADLASIMASNNRALTSFGNAGINLLDALRNVMVVAEPLVERFGALAERFSETALQASRAGRYSGTMAAFFDRAWDAGSKLWGILKNVAGAIYNLGRVSRPSGDTLLDDLAAAAEKLRAWTADPKNQAAIQQFFQNAVPVMEETGRLLNHIIEVFGRFGAITGGNTLKGLFGVLNGMLSVLDGIASLPGGGPMLSAIFELSGVGLGLGLVSKALGGVVGNLKTISTLGGGALGILTGGRLGGGAGTAAFTKLSSAWETLRIRALYAGDALRRGGTAIADAASAAGRGVASVGRFVLEYAKLAGRAALDGIKAAGSGFVLIGQLAKTGTVALGGFIAQYAKLGGKAALDGLRAAGSGLATVGSAAKTGVTAVGQFATAQLASARASTASAIASARQRVVTLAVATANRIAAAATWLWNIAMRANPIGLIITALVALVAGVIYAYTHFTTFRNIVNAVFSWLRTAVVAVINFVRAHWQLIIAIMLGPIGIILGLVITNFTKIKNAVSAAINWILNFVRGHWKLLITIMLGPLGAIIALVVSNWTRIKNAFSAGISWVTGRWHSFWSGLRNLASSIASAISGKINSFLSGARTAFSRGVSAISTAWARLKEAAKRPVNFVIGTVYNEGIRKLWNTVMGWLHLKGLQLGTIPLLASGGPIPAQPGLFNRPTAIVGEGKRKFPEYVIPTDPKYRRRSLALWAAAGGDLQMMAGGGVLGSILGGVKKVAGTIGSIAEEAVALLTNPKKVWDSLVHKFVAVKSFAGPWGSAISAIPKKLLGEVWTAASQIIKAFNAGYGSDARGVVAAAKKYIGKGDDRGPNNNMFTRAWGMPGAPWCAIFVSTAIKDAHAGKHYPGYPSAAVRSYLGAMKHVPILQARPGDLATYHNGGHINIIESANPAGASATTIGGNQNALVMRGVRTPQAVLRPMARGGILSEASRIFGYEAFHTDDSHERRTPLIQLLSRLSGGALEKVVGALLRSKLQVTKRDSGGPLAPGRNVVDNDTGLLEWVLTPEALALIGGPRGGAALNSFAARVYRSRGTATSRTALAGAVKPGVNAQVNVFPQPRQSEHEIGMIAARKLGMMLS